MIYRWEVHVVVVVIMSTFTVRGLIEDSFTFLLLYCLLLLFKDLEMGGSCCCGCYIVYYYCIRFDRGMVHVLVG